MADPDIKIEPGSILCNFIIHAGRTKWVGVHLQVANRPQKPIIVIIKSNRWNFITRNLRFLDHNPRLRSNEDETVRQLRLRDTIRNKPIFSHFADIVIGITFTRSY